MTIARSEDINENNSSIFNLFKNFFCKHFGFNRGNLISEILYRSVYDAKTFIDQSKYT